MGCTTSQPCYPKDFYQLIINFLCQIKAALQPAASGVRYDWENLCDPDTGLPIFVRFKYLTNGTLDTTAAFNADGTTYTSPIGDLVACGGGDSSGIVRYDYEVLCAPTSGLPVLLRFAYHTDGTVTGVAGFNPDGSAYGGSLAALVSCAGGGGSVFNGYAYQSACDPVVGVPLLVRIHYDTDGTILDTAAFYSDGAAYTGDVGALISCDEAANNRVWWPNPNNSSIISNPGVGLQTVNKTIDKTNTGGSNPNNYPMRCAHYRYPWFLLESTEGVYDFSEIIIFLNKAGQYNQHVNLRIYESDPPDQYGVPNYAYNYAGWQATQEDDPTTSALKFCYWGDASVRNGFQNMLAALYAAISSHPAFGSIDVGWGVFNENTYSGTHYLGTKTGSAPAVPIGNELPDLTLAEAQGFYNMFAAAVPNANILKVSHTSDLGSFNYGVGYLRMGNRLDGWGYKNNPGGCPGGGVQMCTIAPATFISPGTYPNAWTFGQCVQETWDRLYTGSTSWLTLGYDYATSFIWARDTAHASELNVKQQFNPPSPMKAAFETMLLRIGFRYQLVTMRHDREVTAGNNIGVSTRFYNAGNAPNYHTQKIAFLLRNPTTKQEYTWISNDLAQWQPGSYYAYNHAFQVPSWFGPGSAQLFVGLVDSAGIPQIQLANDGDALDRYWYVGGTADTVDVDNPSPTTAPATAYGLQSVYASNQGLRSVSYLLDLSTFDNSDFTLACMAKFDSFPAGRSVNMTLFGREGFGSAGSNQFWVGYRASADRLAISVDNGSTSYTVNADAIGQPQTGVWYKVFGQFNNTTKQLGIQIDQATLDSTVITGSIRTDTALQFTIAGGGVPYYFDGIVAEPRIYNKILTSAEKLEAFNNGLPLPYSKMSNTLKYGLRYSWELTETSGNRVDARQAKGLLAVGTPTRVQIA